MDTQAHNFPLAAGNDQEVANSWDKLPQTPTDPEITALRDQLFKREIAIINKLKLMLDGGQRSRQEMDKIIADTIGHMAGKDERLISALAPTIETVVTKSMQLHQDDFVNILFPLMGPSIRKSIAENFRSMLNSFSQSLETALSWRGLHWRFEALRSGKSFSDVVFLHTIVYRVERVFFIHSQTGLVLSHIQNEGMENQDADMVSAMLTAIGDFAGDCFATGSTQEHLEALHMGEYLILIEAQGDAYLACVVRGTPPVEELRNHIRDVLDTLVVEYGAQLSSFTGDTSAFSHSTRHLEGLLEARYAKERKPLPSWGKAVTLIVGLVIVGLIGWWSLDSARSQLALDSASRILQDEPGVIVLDIAKTIDGRRRLMLLKDDLARDPVELISGNMLADEIIFQILPFVSLEPVIVERRVRNAIALPESVEMTLDEGVLTLSGTAPMNWINNTRTILQNLPGIKWVNTEELTDPAMQRIVELITAIEEIDIEFPLGKATPIPRDAAKLERAADMLVELEYAASRVGLTPRLTIYGHADRVGSIQSNYDISQARTRTLAALLYARSSTIQISMYGMGSSYPKDAHAQTNNQTDRRIELRVYLMQSSQVNR